MVSIIVPVYKVEKYLRECVDSILAQTYKDIEVILVDDGSPDGSPAICDEYAKKDTRVRVVHKENGGLSSARNAGIDIAKGEYIAFCDSDDYIDADMIEILASVAEEHRADFVGCESVVLDSKGNILPIYHSETDKKTFKPTEFLRSLFYDRSDCSVCNKLFLRSTIGESRFVKGRNNEDIIFLSEIIHRCQTIIQINKPFYHYRVTEGSITHAFNERSLDQYKNLAIIEKIIKKCYTDIDDAWFFYKCNITKTTATSIVRHKKRYEEPFKSTYSELKSVLRQNYSKILKSKDINVRMKFAVSLVLVL